MARVARRPVDFANTGSETLEKELKALEDERIRARSFYLIAQKEVERRRSELDKISIAASHIRSELNRRQRNGTD